MAIGHLLASFDAVDDVVLTPMLGNPFCFDALGLGMRHGRYVSKRGTIAPFAPLAPASTVACRERPDDQPTAPFAPVSDASSNTVRWHGEWSAPESEFSRLAQQRCEVAAFAQFARAPYWIANQNEWLIGDLRYDRQPGRDFADLSVPFAQGPCPQAVPAWSPPRAALLQR
jgi:hypothetical protein